jgi:hypothetical protein
VGDYGWLGAWGLREAFCLTFARDLDDREMLRRMGVDSTTIKAVAELNAAFNALYDHAIVAGRLAGWAFAFEKNGYEGSRSEVMRAVSTGGAAVSVFRNVNNIARFMYAVDGVVRVECDPYAPSRRYGGEPDALVPLMREIGLNLDGDGWYPEGLDQALRLADRITGVHLDGERLGAPLSSGRLAPLLPDPPRSTSPAWLMREDRELATAIESADEALLRRVTVAEARRSASEAGIAGEPVVAQALAAAERGELSTVDNNSELGLLLRRLACESDAAGRSPAIPTRRHRMTETERYQAFRRHSAGIAVQSAVYPDTRHAAYGVLGDVVPVRDADAVARRARILRELGTSPTP